MAKDKHVGQAVQFRAPNQLVERFNAAMQVDIDMHGHHELTMSRWMRDAMRDYCERIESIAMSEEGRHAAKVLRGAHKRTIKKSVRK